MSKPGLIGVMIVDDHPVVCAGLAAIISTQSDMKVIAQASNGIEAVDLFRSHQPDVTLMDLRMPRMGGVEAIRAIRETTQRGSFIVLTTYQGDVEIRRALEAGALAYLLKGMPHADLLKAIRAVYSGIRYLPTEVRKALDECPPGPELSPREMEVLRLIVKGLSNKQIADALGITEGTVKWHVNIIFGRLNVSDRTQAAVAALHRGIMAL